MLEVAPDLLGCTLSIGGVTGLIVETEAYHQSEPSCHAFRGPTPRARVMFDEPGTAYIYRSYGIHTLLNIVVEPAGIGAAVLIRALQPMGGLDAMQQRRSTEDPLNLCSGPGKLTQALGVTLEHNETSVLGDGPLTALRREAEPMPVAVGTRIGISSAQELPWRFAIGGSRYMSKPLI